MAIVASLPNHNPFSSLPRNSPSKRRPYQNPNRPPIPIPKYPPKVKPLKSQTSHKTPPKPPNQDQQNHPSFIKIPHNRTKYYKPISPHGERIVSDSDDPNRAVLIGDSGVSYLLPDAPFEFQFSYSEVPKSKPVAIREPAFLPFAPPSMPRPWTGKAPLKSKREKEMKKNKIALFDSFNPPSSEMRGIKEMQMPRAYKLGEFQKERRSREEILGEPLSRAEIKALVQPLLSDNRQVNLGRDGLTHNMLDLINSHWKRQQVCKVKCKGVPTVDMDNVARCLEEKTGGKIIHRAGGVVYLFRGRYYNYHTRPQYPLMLWKPAAPVYPKLIQDAPEGLTKEEADKLRQKGKSLLAICKLAKNGVYVSLVNDVRHAFEGSALVKVDCRGLDASDYKKIGAKLKELVPCVLLSFDNEQILMWRGHDWKSMYPATTESKISHSSTGSDDNPCEPSPNKVSSSPRMMTLWNRAVESNKAFLLDIIDLTPDALLEKVEEFEGKVQATEHSYPALLVHGEDRITNFAVHDEEDFDDLSFSEEDDDLEDYVDDPFEAESSDQRGSLPVDLIAKKFLND